MADFSASAGRGRSENNLGFMYSNGRGVPQDDAEAVRWYRLAAEQGEAGAQVQPRVCMYSNGRGVSQDDAEAVRWFRLAAEQGKAGAQNNLGVMYSNGRGVPQDLHLPRAGQFCGRRRSQAGSPPSQVRPSPTNNRPSFPAKSGYSGAHTVQRGAHFRFYAFPLRRCFAGLFARCFAAF